tara:strand:+ start:3596 stop:4549 length:954 start_codon:yes stop_codon:yes gene_type:complete
MAEAGALTGLTGEDRYPVYQTSTFTPNIDPAQLQNVYGTGAMPQFQFVDRVQTGDRKYNPADPRDQAFLESYEQAKQELEAQEGSNPNLPSVSEIITKGVIPMVAIQAVEQMVTGYLDPALQDRSAGQRLLAGAKETFGQLPSQALEASKSAGYKLADDGLAAGQFYVPELANRELATSFGMEQDFDQLSKAGLLEDGVVTSGTTLGSDPTLNIPGTSLSYPTFSKVGQEDFDSAITQAPSTMERARRVGEKFVNRNRVMATAAGAGVDVISRLAAGDNVKKAVKNAGSSALTRHAINSFLPAELSWIGNFASKLFF